MGEYPFAAAFVLGYREHGDKNDYYAGARPEDAYLVYQVQVASAEAVDHETDEHDCPEHENCLPLVGYKVFVEK